MKCVACLAWVPRGIAASKPTKVRLSKQELKQLLTGDGELHEETSESETAEPGPSEQKAKPGLRGSGDRQEDLDETEEKGDKYDLDSYDAKEEVSGSSGMKGIATFASEHDDPYVTVHNDESDDDVEDFQIQASDNLILAGRVLGHDEYCLEVYVYSSEEDSCYVHHDYVLECPPICIESIPFDPASNSQGNLCALGSMSPVIELYDLDIVDTIEPVITLGARKKVKKGASKSDGEPQAKKKKAVCHSDAVLSLSWNATLTHLLASGSADSDVILWDLHKATGAMLLDDHKDKVSAIQWHPVESNLLLSGSADRIVKLWDARVPSVQKEWKLAGEIEQALWDAKNPFAFAAASDSGHLYHVDTRMAQMEPTGSLAHENGVTGISFSPDISGCLISCGANGHFGVWRLNSENQLESVWSQPSNLSQLYCCQFCPDDGHLAVFGGKAKEGLQLWSLNTQSKVCEAFGLDLVPESNGLVQSGEGAQAGDDNAKKAMLILKTIKK